MTPTRDGFILSTGKEVYANRCLVSIPIVDDGDSYQQNPLRFGEGYDGGFSVSPDPDDWDNGLTIAEGVEICDAMIMAWRKRRRTLKKMLK